MAVVGETPESGIRVEIERSVGDDAKGPWTYRGTVQIPEMRFPVTVNVDDQGTVDVSFDEAPTVPTELSLADLGERIRLIVRTAYKQAKADGEPPPRRITRWRGAKSQNGVEPRE